MAQFDIGVHAVVFDDIGQVLLAHRQDMDLWDLPGGGMEHGELPTEAIIRETREETGFDIHVVKLLAIGVGVPPENALGFLFFGKIISGGITLGDESDDVRFFAVAALPENLSPRKRAMVQLAIQNPESVIFSHINLPRAKQYREVYGKEEN